MEPIRAENSSRGSFSPLEYTLSRLPEGSDYVGITIEDLPTKHPLSTSLVPPPVSFQRPSHPRQHLLSSDDELHQHHLPFRHSVGTIAPKRNDLPTTTDDQNRRQSDSYYMQQRTTTLPVSAPGSTSSVWQSQQQIPPPPPQQQQQQQQQQRFLPSQHQQQQQQQHHPPQHHFHHHQGLATTTSTSSTRPPYPSSNFKDMLYSAHPSSITSTSHMAPSQPRSAHPLCRGNNHSPYYAFPGPTSSHETPNLNTSTSSGSANTSPVPTTAMPYSVPQLKAPPPARRDTLSGERRDSLQSALLPPFRRVYGRKDLRPTKITYPSHRKKDTNGSYISPLQSLTTRLVETYRSVNPSYNYDSKKKPRRVLTKPSKGTKNEGYDNDDSDYILYVNDILGAEEGHKYLILDILGQGTFGQVVKCQNMKTQEIVAVKVVKNKPAYFNQSMMEVTILELLNEHYDKEDRHHLIRLLDTFIHRRHLCLVFELLSVNLYELIKQNAFHGLSTNLVRVFTTQLLDALTVLNEAKIIHCDLKPENVLLKNLESPTIKVIDFGSACHVEQTVYTYIQSRFYRSPEVLLGLPYNCSIDMWSLGCIAAELFLGLPLFPGSSEYNQVTRIVDMLGSLPAYMLEMGKNAREYFDRYVDEYGRKQYRLKSIEQYSREHNCVEQPSKRYFSATKLHDIIISYPYRKGLSQREVQKEMQNRQAFIDFLEGLLNLDPIQRWSPQQAKLHPFITGERFTGKFTPPQQLVSSKISSGSPKPTAIPLPSSRKQHQHQTSPIISSHGSFMSAAETSSASSRSRHNHANNSEDINLASSYPSYAISLPHTNTTNMSLGPTSGSSTSTGGNSTSHPAPDSSSSSNLIPPSSSKYSSSRPRAKTMGTAVGAVNVPPQLQKVASQLPHPPGLSGLSSPSAHTYERYLPESYDHLVATNKTSPPLPLSLDSAKQPQQHPQALSAQNKGNLQLNSLPMHLLSTQQPPPLLQQQHQQQQHGQGQIVTHAPWLSPHSSNNVGSSGHKGVDISTAAASVTSPSVARTKPARRASQRRRYHHHPSLLEDHSEGIPDLPLALVGDEILPSTNGRAGGVSGFTSVLVQGEGRLLDQPSTIATTNSSHPIGMNSGRSPNSSSPSSSSTEERTTMGSSGIQMPPQRASLLGTSPSSYVRSRMIGLGIEDESTKSGSMSSNLGRGGGSPLVFGRSSFPSTAGTTFPPLGGSYSIADGARRLEPSKEGK
ncbi:uncharacterized protein VTP21DRAFT_2674 [Calcarisporiella thermophila]|uniref:uncharacterized protein n=1 Tax=Calcarisporiella thermophila TaxID=911321 RepID=UPI003743D476